jgi:hypothetical protein
MANALLILNSVVMDLTLIVEILMDDIFKREKRSKRGEQC